MSSRKRFGQRKGYGHPPRNTYSENDTWLCTGCYHPVAAHIDGQCQIRGVVISATMAGVTLGPCPCRVEHSIFAPVRRPAS